MRQGEKTHRVILRHQYQGDPNEVSQGLHAWAQALLRRQLLTGTGACPADVDPQDPGG